jgi:hypothetical protein
MGIIRRFLKRHLQPYINAALRVEQFSTMSVRSSLAALRTEALLATERARDPKRLLSFGFKGYSQNDEDGILQEIFQRISPAANTFIEIGVGWGGIENNTIYLLLSGWRGLWVEAGAEAVSAIRKGLAEYIEGGQLSLVHTFVDKENVDSLIRGAGFEGEVDLLSIDIDGNDYWIWEAISAVNPRVVVIEYNPTFRPPVSLVMEYGKDFVGDGTNFFGASLKAFEELGAEKGYALVGCCLAGANAFFVRRDLVQDRFCAPFTAENHYEPARYSLFVPYPDAHAPGVGMYKRVERGHPKE